MINFGGKKKDDDDKDESAAQLGQAMRSMSDQIARQAQEIKQLQETLAAAKKDAAEGDAAERALAAAKARMASMEAEVNKLKTKVAGAAGGVAGAAGGAAGALGGALGVGVTKIGPSAPAAGTVLGGAAADDDTLRVGGVAYVQNAGGKNLRLRNNPGLSTTVIDGLAPGTQMTLLGGPQEKDGYPWWNIRTADGREGWVAGTELVTKPE